MGNENSFETGRIFVMEDSGQVLVKVILFQLRERVVPQDGAMPSYEPRNYLFVLLIDLSFVSKTVLER